MSNNKISNYTNLIISILETFFIVLITCTLLARIRVKSNFAYYLLKWLLIILSGVLLTITVAFVLTLIFVVLWTFLSFFIRLNEMPIFLNTVIDGKTVGDFYINNFYLTLPIIWILHRLINSATSQLALELFAKTQKQIKNCQDNNLLDLIGFVTGFVLPILKWS